MRDEIGALVAWQDAGQVFALATVIDTSRSAPRSAGATLAVHPDGRIVGNVSGGCVDPAVVEIAQQVLAEGGTRRVHFGYSDDEAVAVGLTCGGEVEVFVRRVDQGALPLRPLADALFADVPVVLATVVDGGATPAITGTSLVITEDARYGAFAETQLGEVLALEATAALDRGGVTLRRLGASGERMGGDVKVLIEPFTERPRLIVFGAIDYAAAVATVGRFLGFRVTVCDARSPFATADRFPDADEVLVEWPHRYLARTSLDARAAICVLTHDPKFDVPAIMEALRSPASYIGIMGSRATDEDRRRRLREAGVDEDGLTRLRSPIGLSLGGRSPQETAIAIAAELVMVRNRASGRPLRETSGPIHAARD